MPDAHSAAVITAPAAAPWDAFIQRFGFSTVVAMLASILSICWVQNSGVTPNANIATFQLLLAMIVMGCIGVLAFRNGDA